MLCRSGLYHDIEDRKGFQRQEAESLMHGAFTVGTTDQRSVVSEKAYVSQSPPDLTSRVTPKTEYTTSPTGSYTSCTPRLYTSLPFAPKPATYAAFKNGASPLSRPATRRHVSATRSSTHVSLLTLTHTSGATGYNDCHKYTWLDLHHLDCRHGVPPARGVTVTPLYSTTHSRPGTYTAPVRRTVTPGAPAVGTRVSAHPDGDGATRYSDTAPPEE
jgi:hypothetical protein